MSLAADEASGDRFAGWPRWRACLVLLLATGLLLMAFAPRPQDGGAPSALAQPPAARPVAADDGRDADLALYDRIIARLSRGEDYYDVITAEHRRANFPLQPGLTVRLPTLARLQAYLGSTGTLLAGVSVVLACAVAWWRRLSEEPGGRDRRALAVALLLFGMSLMLNPTYRVVHEVWSGTLIALALALYRPNRWLAALVITAAALAIRELALPFVLLFSALAVLQRDWRQAAAWGALILLFFAGLTLHLRLVAEHVAPDDARSLSWLALRGVEGWWSNLRWSSNLHFLPTWAAYPLILLALLGWAGWKSALGTIGTLLQFGYGLLFMIAGRNDNFYWGMLAAPSLFVGLAFAPRAIASLVRSATARP